MMSQNTAILELTIQRRWGGSWPIVAELQRPDELLPIRREGQFTYDEVALREASLDPRAYGEILGRAVFRDDVRDLLATARGAAVEAVRVLLAIEDEALRELRWERLCAPIDGLWEPLAQQQTTPFAQYLPSRVDRRFPTLGRGGLRALVVASSPRGLEQYNLTPFDAAGAANRAHLAFGTVPCDVLAPAATSPPTLDALCAALTAQPYAILHLICHGRATESGSALFLDDATGGVDVVPAERLVERLRTLKGSGGLPHLIFLASCQSAVGNAQGLGGLAHRLVREVGLPAVLAMTDSISVETAQDLGDAFYQRLLAHGSVDIALAEAAAGLAERPDVGVPALFSRLGARPLFSSSLDRPLGADEIRVGLAHLEALVQERAPVLTTALARASSTLEATLGVEEAALSTTARDERAHALAEVGALCEETTDLSFAALARGQTPPSYQAVCPFPGLAAFTADEQRFFFGREDLVGRLAARLEAAPFLAVLGPSGSGKSSVTRAGLIPLLRGRPVGLRLAVMRPGASPLAALEVALREADGDGLPLLLVDQFEEVFTLCADAGERDTFFTRILDMAGSQRVVLTMRADFWGECAPYRTLVDRMLASQELIAPLGPQELRRIIELQSQVVGLRLEAGLADTILNDVASEPGAMPLLQHALRQLWDRRRGRWLRADEYTALGGVRQAIASTADALLTEASPTDQELIRDIFTRLTRLGDGATGERRDTRQRVALAELTAGRSLEDTRRLVSRLADVRLVVTGVSGATGHEEVEVVHEALIHHWPRLRDWLAEDAALLRLRAAVREATHEWERHPGDDAYLVHRGRRLDEATALLSHQRVRLNEGERAYLEACQASDVRIRTLTAELRFQILSVDQPVTLVLSARQPGDEFALEVTAGHSQRSGIARTTFDLVALRQLEGDPAAYGTRLAELCIADPAMAAIVRPVGEEAASQGRQLRLWVRLPPDDEALHGLWWEALALAPAILGWPAELRVQLARFVASDAIKLRSKPPRSARALVPDGPAGELMLDSLRQTLGGLPVERFHAVSTRAGAQDVLYLACTVVLGSPDQLALGGDVPRDLVGFAEILRRLPELPQLVLLELSGAPADVRAALAILAPRLVRAGAVAVVALPAGLDTARRDAILTAILRQLRTGGSGDIVEAVGSLSTEPAGSTVEPAGLPRLFTGVADGRLWYTPGLSDQGRGKGFNPIPALISSIQRGHLTPVLGPRLAEEGLGSYEAIFSRAADTFGFPGPLHEHGDRFRVAQYLASSQDRVFPRDELLKGLRKGLLERYQGRLPKGAEELPIRELVTAAGALYRADNPDNAHQLLASLPLPIFLTVAYDDLLADALVDAYKTPTTMILPWNEELERENPVDLTIPTSEHPLIYHLWGRLEIPDSLVISRNDLSDVQLSWVRNDEMMPRVVWSALADSALLFVGFMFDDSFESLLRMISSVEGVSRHRRYAHLIQLDRSFGHGFEAQAMRRYIEESVRIQDLSIYWGSVSDLMEFLIPRLPRSDTPKS